MSFDVVAASRVEQRKITAGRHVLATGIQFGVAGAFLGIVGILSMFNNRPIIVGTLTLGYATLACIPLAAGILAARRELYPNALQRAAGGLAAGAIAVAIIALLPIVMSLVNLRTIFVALDQPLLKMLSFELNPVPAGIGCLLVFGIVLGGLGALLVMLPQRIRRPLVGGIIGAGIAGLFQELIQPILANSSVTKSLHDLLYTWSGLKLQGAVICSLSLRPPSSSGIGTGRVSPRRSVASIRARSDGFAGDTSHFPCCWRCCSRSTPGTSSGRCFYPSASSSLWAWG
jgi:hypothetical protein